MTAMIQERNTTRREGDKFTFPVAATALVFTGAMVAVNASGLAEPGKTATGLQGVGVAQETVDNQAGADGERSVTVRRGCFLMKMLGGDPVTRADVGKVCYIADDQTIAKTNGTGTRSPAGIVRDVDSSGAWVEF